MALSSMMYTISCSCMVVSSRIVRTLISGIKIVYYITDSPSFTMVTVAVVWLPRVMEGGALVRLRVTMNVSLVSTMDSSVMLIFAHCTESPLLLKVSV